MTYICFPVLDTRTYHLLDGINFDMFMTLEGTLDELSAGAKKLLKVKERLEMFNISDSKKKALGKLD